MVHIDKSVIGTPAILRQGDRNDKSAMATQALQIAYDSGHREFIFNTKIYGHKTVKAALKVAQNDKCCFCESKVGHISHGDVEHFRPKAALLLKESTPLIYPGYYWLAYDFNNLFFSCQICNQAFKKNFFPIADETYRVRSHHDALKLEYENPLIVNPGKDQPAEHIFFNREVPIGIDEKGKATILRTGLDRESLNDHRLKYLVLLEQLAKHALAGDSKCLGFLREAAQPDEEYSLMVRCNFLSLL